MRKRTLLGTLILFSLSLHAQIPEDVLKYSWQPTNGTARINAIGGAMGSLGGDISATFVNPAGLGFFKTSEIVLSPGFNFLKNKSNFRGTKASDNGSNFNLGTSGIVAGWQGSGRWSSKAISFGITRTANFSNKIYYTGKNDFSSHAEQYAAEAAGSGLTLDEILSSTSVSIGTRMAVYTYLIDTATLGSNPNPDVVSSSMYDQLKNGGAFLLNQSHSIETSGGITELAIGYAANMDDKLYIGGSIGLPIVKYQKKSTFREEDATGNNANYFDFSELSETFTTKGIGINAKLGIIVKPVELVRLGFTVHTPTWYSFEDSYKANMSVNTENSRSNPGTVTVSSDVVNGGQNPTYKYELISPWKFMLSGSYVLREAEDIRQQKGFLTADVEYVTYKSNKFRNAEDYDDNGYYNQLNATMKDYYKGAINFRVGGELKFTTIMTRLGFAYYGNPYSDKELKANKMFISGGLGYRNAGIFIDLTYVHGLQKDVNFPYRLPDKANTFATTKGAGGNVMLTVGFKI
ncbi:MAG: aromatic hydrocarbon degradation protein [Chitinophagaceae bacterium]